MLPSPLVGELMARGLLYQDAAGNCTFVCLDATGIARGAALVGTDRHHPFKGMAVGSDSRYGWWWPREDATDPARTVIVTESPIDACSLATLHPGLRRFLSLNGLRAGTLEAFLAEHPEVRTVVLGLDSDEPGQQAAAGFTEELKAKGYGVAVLKPPGGFKDWNEALVAKQ